MTKTLAGRPRPRWPVTRWSRVSSTPSARSWSRWRRTAAGVRCSWTARSAAVDGPFWRIVVATRSRVGASSTTDASSEPVYFTRQVCLYSPRRYNEGEPNPAVRSYTLPFMSEHPSIARFRAELSSRGGTGRIVVLPDSVHTAALAAEALGCEVGAIANSLLFAARPARRAGPGPHLRSAPRRHREGRGLDRRPRPQAGQAGVRPRAHRPGHRRRVAHRSPGADPHVPRPALQAYDEIWAAAGHPAAVFSTTYDELRAMTGAQEIAVN